MTEKAEKLARLLNHSIWWSSLKTVKNHMRREFYTWEKSKNVYSPSLLGLFQIKMRRHLKLQSCSPVFKSPCKTWWGFICPPPPPPPPLPPTLRPLPYCSLRLSGSPTRLFIIRFASFPTGAWPVHVWAFAAIIKFFYNNFFFYIFNQLNLTRDRLLAYFNRPGLGKDNFL